MARFMMIVAAAATFVLTVLGARVAAHGMTAPETHRVSDQTAPSAVHATPISGLFERIGDRADLTERVWTISTNASTAAPSGVSTSDSTTAPFTERGAHVHQRSLTLFVLTF
jgi:hypothetical protein